MVRAGVSLPALMQLMGHAQIQTTLVYVKSLLLRSISSMREPWRSTSGPPLS
jgi:site-specific recombinase XerD